MAVQRLRVHLALAVRDTISDSTLPSSLWQSRARGRQLNVSTEHEDFPALLAEALDRLAARDWDAAAAAEALGITASQLVKFLKQEPAALALLNAARHALGLKPLR